MKAKIPSFKIDTSNGHVSLVFQTTKSTCILKFVNESFVIEIDGQIVFSADKL